MAGRKTGDRKVLTLDDLQQVAQVLKSNGTDGELIMSFRDIAPEDINIEEPVFIVFDGLPVPFFIESFTRRGNSKALVRLTDIESQEDVEELAGKPVYIDGDSLPELSIEEDGYVALIGWTVLKPASPSFCSDTPFGEEGGSASEQDKTGNDESAEGIEEFDAVDEIGEITDFIDIPNNPCIEVETKNGAVMIPLHEDFILSLDPEYQEIIMNIPEGLV